jgi:hypothetical protein
VQALLYSRCQPIETSVEGLWHAWSFHGNLILFQACRQIRSIALAFRPDRRPILRWFYEAGLTARRRCVSEITYFKNGSFGMPMKRY